VPTTFCHLPINRRQLDVGANGPLCLEYDLLGSALKSLPARLPKCCTGRGNSKVARGLALDVKVNFNFFNLLVEKNRA
jgi:hypothetical protein